MEIKVRTNRNSTALKWKNESEEVAINLPGRVIAEYSESHELVITAGNIGEIQAYTVDGTKAFEFSFENSEGCNFYTLCKSNASELGVSIVMAHNPELKNERFWQHEILLEAKKIGRPIAKWR